MEPRDERKSDETLDEESENDRTDEERLEFPLEVQAMTEDHADVTFKLIIEEFEKLTSFAFMSTLSKRRINIKH